MKDVVRIARFDGQRITAPDGRILYEVGSYLGGGISGVVYEVERVDSSEHSALKVLNPIGYKLESKAALKQCKVVAQGKPLQSLEAGLRKSLRAENVWWLLHGPSGRVVAAFHDVERGNLIREMTLPMCVEVWGLNFQTEDDDETHESKGPGFEPEGIKALLRAPAKMVRGPQGQPVAIPAIPPKFESFLQSRAKVYREISHMRKLSHHPNVLRLEEVLEMTEDSKMSIFLVLELAKGGELFDRIAVDKGASEGTARTFFRQLLDGVLHCHEQGVCHRDLKPENLLLADEEGSTLKIGDFGLSALSRLDDPDETGAELGLTPMPTTPTPLSSSLPTRMVSTPPSPVRAVSMRKLKSVVGSPFYVAPEILNSGPNGYDGTKADMWSVGVILYAMMHGNLPFDKDLHSCLRFHNFCLWLSKQKEDLSRRVADGKDDGVAARLRKRFDSESSPSSQEPEAKRAMTFAPPAQLPLGAAAAVPGGMGGTHVQSPPVVAPGTGGAPSGHHHYHYQHHHNPCQHLQNQTHGSLSSSSSPVQPGWNSFASPPLPHQHHQNLFGTPQPRPVDVAAIDVASAPTWLFPDNFSLAARSLLCALLTPDPEERLSVQEALVHPWVLDGAPPPAAVTIAITAGTPYSPVLGPAAAPTAAGLAAMGTIPAMAGDGVQSMDMDLVANNLALAGDGVAGPAGLLHDEEGKSDEFSHECMFEDSMEESDFPDAGSGSEQSFRSDDEVSTVAMEPCNAQSPPIAIPKAMAEAFASAAGGVAPGSRVAGLVGRGGGTGGSGSTGGGGVGAGSEGVSVHAEPLAEDGASSTGCSTSFGDVFCSASQSSGPESPPQRTSIMPSPPLAQPLAPSPPITVPEFSLTAHTNGGAAFRDGGPASPLSRQRSYPTTSPSSLSVLLMTQQQPGTTEGNYQPDNHPAQPAPTGDYGTTATTLQDPPNEALAQENSVDGSDLARNPAPTGALQLQVDPLPPYGSPLPAYPAFGSPLPYGSLDARFGRSTSGALHLPRLADVNPADAVPTSTAATAATAAAAAATVAAAAASASSASAAHAMTLVPTAAATASPAATAAAAGSEVSLSDLPPPTHPPQFQDLVKRSTRFVTSIPAAEVLRGIQEILNNDTNPLPPPFRGVPQRTVLHMEDYRLDVKWGGVLVFSVQVFLIRGDRGRSQYMVEFQRGHAMDIFQFKRYFEDVRDKLQQYIKEDRSVSYLDATGLLPRRIGDNTWM